MRAEASVVAVLLLPFSRSYVACHGTLSPALKPSLYLMLASSRGQTGVIRHAQDDRRGT